MNKQIFLLDSRKRLATVKCHTHTFDKEPFFALNNVYAVFKGPFTMLPLLTYEKQSFPENKYLTKDVIKVREKSHDKKITCITNIFKMYVWLCVV